jgi:hypothetical protein
VLWSDNNQYSLWINYQGASYELTDFNMLFRDDTNTESVSGADEQTIRTALTELGMTIPDGAEFTKLDSGWYQFNLKMIASDNEIYNGKLTCSYYGTEGIGEIDNYIISCEPVKDYEIISEQEAYNKIKNGEFAMYTGNTELNIQIESCEIVYIIDSKGYYQPNYKFACTINGEESEIQIPALK